MRPMVNVLIADKREGFVSAFKFELQGESGINVIGVTGDGNEALRMIDDFGPEFLLIDANLDGLDGAALVRRLMGDTVLPRPVIITTDFGQSKEMQDLTAEFDGSHALYSLPSVDEVVERINTIIEDIYAPVTLTEYNASTPERFVSDMLKDVGVSLDTKGFRYFYTLLLHAVEKRGKNCSLTKELYPETGRKYGTSPAAVERLIRHTIESIWKEKNNEALEYYLKMTTVSHPDKPKNSEFIFTAVRYVVGRIEM